MSALGVDHNMITKDPAYVADPAVGNGVLMRFALGAHGIEVTGGVDHGHADQGVRLVGVESPPVRELLATMLTDSDNFIAELLMKEIGLRRAGPPGTTAAGSMAIHEVVTNLCIPIRGVAYDGSGLAATTDGRSESSAACSSPSCNRGATTSCRRCRSRGRRTRWPVASPGRRPGQGPSQGRLPLRVEEPVGLRPRADGRRAVFSIIVNGDLSSRRNKADDAIDDVVTALTTLPP